MSDGKIASAVRLFRKSLAGIALGDQFAMYVPKAQGHVLKDGCYTDLSDEALGAATRYWFAVIERVNSELAIERNVPASVFSTSQSVMALVRLAIEANAKSVEISQSGEICGQDIGVWKISIVKQSDDYDFGPCGVQETWSDDGKRLSNLALSYRIPASVQAIEARSDKTAGDQE